MPQAAYAVSPDNLLALQRSAKTIRNPFGFTLKQTWNSEPVEFPGDGKWRQYVGPLADHLVKHLKSAVLNRIHDQAVEKLRSEGLDKAARKYHVPEEIVSKVHMAITGLPDPKIGRKDEDAELLKMNLEELQKSMAQLEAEAAHANHTVSVAGIQQEAANKALSELSDLGSGQVGSVSGSFSMAKEPIDPNAGSLPTQPLSPATDNVVTPNNGAEFSGLKELS